MVRVQLNVFNFLEVFEVLQGHLSNMFLNFCQYMNFVENSCDSARQNHPNIAHADKIPHQQQNKISKTITIKLITVLSCIRTEFLPKFTFLCFRALLKNSLSNNNVVIFEVKCHESV